MKKIFLLFAFMVPFMALAQYDAGFTKPIVTENGRFVYYELAPLQTEEGEIIFLDRNLGASSNDITSSDSWGDLYQWGRSTDGHEKRLSDTTWKISPTYEAPNSDFIIDETRANDWVSSPDDDLWNGDKKQNNPCPCGYRLPTQKEWRAVLNTGAEIVPNGAGGYYLSVAKGQIKLPCAGLRNAYTGNFEFQGMRGYYWAGDVTSRGMSGCMDFNKAEITTNVTVYGFRAFGRSVRCIKDKKK